VALFSFLRIKVVVLAQVRGVQRSSSLRHSFRDRLSDSDVPLEAIDQAGGWSSVGGVGTNYGKGYSLPKLAEYLRRIGSISWRTEASANRHLYLAPAMQLRLTKSRTDYEPASSRNISQIWGT
jgi:hypothetical protein